MDEFRRGMGISPNSDGMIKFLISVSISSLVTAGGFGVEQESIFRTHQSKIIFT
jgi:hypothetical protein